MQEIMSEVARFSKCHYRTEFSQASVLRSRQDIISALNLTSKSSQGLCLGLALVWLEYQAYKPDVDFFRGAYDPIYSTVLLKAAGLTHIEQYKSIELVTSEWINEDTVRPLLPFCGFKLPVPRDHLTIGLSSREWGFCTKFMQVGWGQKGPPLPRYFLYIFRNVHAVAVCARENGTFDYFDPNAGTVVAPNAAAMTIFLYNYMNAMSRIIRQPDSVPFTVVFRLDVRNIFS